MDRRRQPVTGGSAAELDGGGQAGVLIANLHHHLTVRGVRVLQGSADRKHRCGRYADGHQRFGQDRAVLLDEKRHQLLAQRGTVHRPRTRGGKLRVVRQRGRAKVLAKLDLSGVAAANAAVAGVWAMTCAVASSR